MSTNMTTRDINSSQNDRIQVAVRIRPSKNGGTKLDHASCVEPVGSNSVNIYKRSKNRSPLKSQGDRVNHFNFDHVFGPASTQMQVFESVSKPFLGEFVNGANFTIFAYGATGSGKTHTMMGSGGVDDDVSRSTPGLVHLSVTEVLNQVNATYCGDEKVSVLLSYVEIYNERILDLFNPGKELKLCEDPFEGKVSALGVTELEANTLEKVLKLVHEGNKNRTTAATKMNSKSSRSHAVLQLKLLVTTRSEQGEDSKRESVLTMVDLAGSERASATSNSGELLRQGANINLSLLALGNCINALSKKCRSSKSARSSITSVNYRDSKLTHLLKNSLEGNCRVFMVANVAPESITYEDTLNGLKYAERAKEIKTKAIKNTPDKENVPWPIREARLVTENSELKSDNINLKAENDLLRSKIADQRTTSISEESKMGRISNFCYQSSISETNEIPVKRGRKGANGEVQRQSSAEPKDKSVIFEEMQTRIIELESAAARERCKTSKLKVRLDIEYVNLQSRQEKLELALEEKRTMALELVDVRKQVSELEKLLQEMQDVASDSMSICEAEKVNLMAPMCGTFKKHVHQSKRSPISKGVGSKKSLRSENCSVQPSVTQSNLYVGSKIEVRSASIRRESRIPPPTVFMAKISCK